MGRLLLHAAGFLAVAWLSGCTAVETNQAACLQQAMTASHKAAMGVFKQANDEMLPCQIEQGATRTAFSRDDVFLLAPSDVAAWDRILGGLDDYCAALADLTSARGSAGFTTASEGFGLKIQALIKAVKGSTSPSVANAGAAVSELGGVLIRCKASREARTVAKAADPCFQAVIGGLISALGFENHPPAPAPHGLLATCEAGYRTINAEKIARRFKGDAIAGFDAMTPDERRAAIKDFIAWLRAEQDHDDLVAGLTALAAALDKASAAHAALAQGSQETAGAAFAELRAEMENTVRIYGKFKGG